MRSRLPVISLPLREPDQDVLVDLGEVFRRTYEAGPYRKVLRYDRELLPPVTAEDARWIRERVAAGQGEGTA